MSAVPSPLAFRGVSKRFEGAALPALYPFDLTLEPGTILGLVGRNGAGKSTMIRIAAGILRPSEGHVEIGGTDLGRHPSEARGSIGWVPEAPRFEPTETPLRLLRHLAQLDGHSADEADRRARVQLARLELTGSSDRPIRVLSQGQLRRLALAAAWLEEPQLLLYDEVTNGLDPPGRAVLAESLQALRERGGSALIASHRLEEVEAWCDRIAVLRAGRIVATVPCGEAAAGLARTVRVVVERPPDERLAALRELGQVDLAPHAVTVEAPGGSNRDLVADLVRAGFRIREVQSVRDDISTWMEGPPP